MVSISVQWGLLKANMTILLLPKVVAKHPHNANDNKKGGYVLLCSVFQDKKMLLPELEIHILEDIRGVFFPLQYVRLGPYTNGKRTRLIQQFFFFIYLFIFLPFSPDRTD